MATNFPHAVGGRIGDETFALMEAAIDRFTTTEGALVRNALDDYLPRFMANQGRPQHAELFAKLAQAIDEAPHLTTELNALVRKSTRRRRAVHVFAK